MSSGGSWIGYLLQNNITSQKFFIYEAPVAGKVIFQVDYLYDVWVKEWSVACSHKYQWYVKFKWQASHNNKYWIDIGGEMTSETVNITGMMRDENPIEWIFRNPTDSKGAKYKYWRMWGLSGQPKNGYINLLLMNVE